MYVRGLDTPLDPKALALPVRRALVEAVVGKQVRLVSAEALDLTSFPDLRPSAVGVAVTSAVVTGIVSIIVATAFITVICASSARAVK